ncbi:MAG: hypothetical protein KF861_19480 [Planctomycetaceae bacterium]|nr:hypothetical protein [Planctomycetaceae bacterium]
MSTSLLEVLTNGRVVFWGAITLMCIVPSICHYWYRIRRSELEVNLKQSMIDRGFSPEEIVRVLGANSAGCSSDHS